MPIKNTQKNLEAALTYARLGWRVLPLHSVINGRCACGEPDCDSHGKNPIIKKNWPDVATDDPHQIEEWWSQWPDANVGILTGAASGIFVLDVDPKNGGDEALAQLEQQHGPLPSTVISNTGGGGRHILFKYPLGSDIGNSASRLGPGLDIRGDRGQIVAPPSIHASGGVYAWDENHHPDDLEPAEAPQWIIDKVKSKKQPRPVRKSGAGQGKPSRSAEKFEGAGALLEYELKTLAKVSEGERNDQLNKRAYYIGRILDSGELDEDMVRRQFSETAKMIGLGSEEIADTLNSALEAGKRNPRTPLSNERINHYLAHSQKGDAELFIEEQRGQLCLDRTSGKWFLWTGSHWMEDKKGEHKRRLDDVEKIYQEALILKQIEANAKRSVGEKSAAQDLERLIKRLRERISNLGKSPWQKNVVDQAATGADSLAITGEEWDANTDLLGVSNGVLEFDRQATTVVFRPSQPDDFIRNIIPTPWPGGNGSYGIGDLNDLANGPCFRKFLQDICGGDQDQVRYLQVILGYALTGRVTEHNFFMLHGSEGRNGKTTLTNVLWHVLGNLAGPIDVELLLQHVHNRSADAASPALMALKSKRMVWSPESDKECKLSSSEVKRLTGGDLLTARSLYGAQTTFKPTHTIFMLTNRLPDLDISDAALRERIKVVPFDQRYVDDPKGPNDHRKDPDLIIKLQEDTAHILAWLVQGALIYGKNKKLPECPAVVKATQRYFASKDVVGRFVEKCCFESPGSKLKAIDAYNAYQKWCKDKSIKADSSTEFGMKFSKLFEKKRETDGIYYHDVGLK
ncbi:phage/plasmid primase, P4 family [Desulfoferula mesophila]|uniref:SF3 helicase domain-containing protein n=1 Tax=Desulfoferula mesophila TaxID=3058419 RepID=A0AAU9EZP7_9BACT|nr:hypothetical protein FAK_22290 [Desulfoferula mesophilus]